MMRILACALIALIVAGGLFLFDDMGTGLWVVNLILWPLVAIAGIFVLVRNRVAARQPRRRRTPRGPTPTMIARTQTPPPPRPALPDPRRR